MAHWAADGNPDLYRVAAIAYSRSLLLKWSSRSHFRDPLEFHVSLKVPHREANRGKTGKAATAVKMNLIGPVAQMDRASVS